MGKNKKVAWRKAARTAMREATQQEAQRRYGTATPTFNYRWEHVKAVVKLALRLAELTGADCEVVEAAAWLHDVRKDKGNNHPRAGGRFARKFLRTTDFPAKKIPAVSQAIAAHMGLWLDEPLTNLEAQVLWDADKLAKIGLTAVFHWTGLWLNDDAPVTTRAMLKKGRAAKWQKKTVASMHTAPARQAAVRRLAAYDALWAGLETELNGDDLLES